jgi:undecaprenyl-phosphate 4-deoxy-4-formamido-L-arabinose transferase
MTPVSVVIPVFNAAGTIEELCERLIQELGARWELQIVLVDDGSSDGSFAACQRLHKGHPEVINALRLSRNFGEHNAVMAGLHYAEGEFCVIMDDDFQNPPSEVQRLLTEISKGYDVVYSRYDTKEHAFWRNLGSRLHNRIATWALSKPAELYLSSFKAITRFVVREVIRYPGPYPYLDAIILRTTRNIGVLTTAHQPRTAGASGYTLVKLFSLWSNMIVAFSMYPLRIIGLYGLILALVGFFYGAYTVVALVSPSMTDPGPLQRLNASIWFFRGSTLLVLSIIGEYVGRIYRSLNHAPQFIVREELRAAPQRSTTRTSLNRGGAFEGPTARP